MHESRRAKTGRQFKHEVNGGTAGSKRQEKLMKKKGGEYKNQENTKGKRSQGKSRIHNHVPES